MNEFSVLPKIWSKKSYYQFARHGSLDIDHPGMKILQKLAIKSNSILDLGCGEGTRLNILSKNSQRCMGIDISETAIKMAKKSFPKLNFKVGSIKKIKFPAGSFNLVYSAFVLEHLKDPEEMIDGAIMVVAEGGYLVFIAPNFGAPNRSSPPFKGSRFKKLFIGFFSDLQSLFVKRSSLDWEKVIPIATGQSYKMDWDTTVEPYFGTLMLYLQSKGLKVEEASSCWSLELKGANIYQKIFKILGQLHLYPFWMWGPHLLIVARKVTSS